MKTALLNTLQGLPSIHTLDEVTENTFILGTRQEPNREEAEEKRPNARESVESNRRRRGILVVPDFSTILAMNKNKQPVILSQLRRIYNGSFNREFRTKENISQWRKAGVRGHCLPG